MCPQSQFLCHSIVCMREVVRAAQLLVDFEQKIIHSRRITLLYIFAQHHLRKDLILFTFEMEALHPLNFDSHHPLSRDKRITDLPLQLNL